MFSEKISIQAISRMKKRRGPTFDSFFTGMGLRLIHEGEVLSFHEDTFEVYKWFVFFVAESVISLISE